MANEADDDVQELDLRGLKCPLPALRAAKALRSLSAGATLVVRCTDPLAAIDIPHLVAQRGDTLLSTTHDGDTLVFTILTRAKSPLP